MNGVNGVLHFLNPKCFCEIPELEVSAHGGEVTDDNPGKDVKIWP